MLQIAKNDKISSWNYDSVSFIWYSKYLISTKYSKM